MAPDEEAFEQFVHRWKKKLRGIAYKTLGEQQYEDVVQEAWLMACTLHAENGGPLDLLNDHHQRRLLAHLYQHLVRYTELNVRHAVRLQHATSGSDDIDDVHPLPRTLASDGGRSVLDTLLDRDAKHLLERGLLEHGSLAAAYVQLLRHFDERMEAVALRLRLSVSYADRRCAYARQLAERMQHIAVPRSGALPGPWRRYRLVRQPLQLSFDFGEQLGLS